MKELDKEMNKVLAEDIQESARYRPFVYGSKGDRLSDLCTHEWKTTEHKGFNLVCVKCNLLKKEGMKKVPNPRQIWKENIPMKITKCSICETEQTCFQLTSQGYTCLGCLSHYESNCGGRAKKE